MRSNGTSLKWGKAANSIVKDWLQPEEKHYGRTFFYQPEQKFFHLRVSKNFSLNLKQWIWTSQNKCQISQIPTFFLFSLSW